jgi:hypothetical protein
MREGMCSMVVVLVLAALATSARAQPASPVLDLTPGGFSESLLERGIKGRDTIADPLRMLVGLHRGWAAGPFKIDEVGVVLPIRRMTTASASYLRTADIRH